jgi:hypothetical protein
MIDQKFVGLPNILFRSYMLNHFLQDVGRLATLECNLGILEHRSLPSMYCGTSFLA